MLMAGITLRRGRNEYFLFPCFLRFSILRVSLHPRFLGLSKKKQSRGQTHVRFELLRLLYTFFSSLDNTRTRRMRYSCPLCSLLHIFLCSFAHRSGYLSLALPRYEYLHVHIFMYAEIQTDITLTGPENAETVFGFPSYKQDAFRVFPSSSRLHVFTRIAT